MQAVLFFYDKYLESVQLPEGLVPKNLCVTWRLRETYEGMALDRQYFVSMQDMPGPAIMPIMNTRIIEQDVVNKHLFLKAGSLGPDSIRYEYNSRVESTRYKMPIDTLEVSTIEPNGVVNLDILKGKCIKNTEARIQKILTEYYNTVE